MRGGKRWTEERSGRDLWKLASVKDDQEKGRASDRGRNERERRRTVFGKKQRVEEGRKEG